MLLIENSNPKGFGENHNNAFRSCDTKLFFVINPDLRLPSNFFKNIIRELNNVGSFGIATPKIIDSNGKNTDHLRENLSLLSIIKRHFLKNYLAKETKDKFLWLSGCFHIFNSETFKGLSGYNERFFMYCEDYEISARAFLKNLHLIVFDNVHAYHDAQRTSRKSLKLFLMHIRSLLMLWTGKIFWRICLYDIKKGKI